jgi:predicted polyphosphate/ATP-dependent NAD kinase
MAGVGGPAGLKGSDDVYDEAIQLGSVSRVVDRVKICLSSFRAEDVRWVTAPSEMGADLLESMGLAHEVLDMPVQTGGTSAEDTRTAVSLLNRADIDLLLFAGGDGTARDIADVFDGPPAVLGIPCGVKMHSGVFATSPKAAGELLDKLLTGELLSVIATEVRDIDETSFRVGIVKTRFYGELPVIDDLRYMQQTKVGGREVDELVVQEIAADFIENMDPETTYIMGSGSTIATVMASMGLEPTLLGIDVVRGGSLVAADVNERELLQLLADEKPARIVVTAIGGQGHIFGRGNQQLSPAVIRRVGADAIDILATKNKLSALNHRPLLVDTGDEKLDSALAGMKSIITGYEDRVLYRVA